MRRAAAVLDPAFAVGTIPPRLFGFVDLTATRDGDTGAVAVFAVNRSPREQATLRLDLRGLGIVPVEHLAIAADQDTEGTSAAPRSHALPLMDGAAQVTLPPASWSLLRFAPATADHP